MRLRLIMVLVIAPLLVLAGYFAFVDIEMQRAKLAHAHDIAFKTVEETLVNDLVHEMQKERGYSAGFIASSGRNFPQKLKEQRQLTGEAIDAMQRGVTAIFETRPALAAEITGNLSALTQMRAQVDDLALKVPQMAQYYSHTINLLLEMARPELNGEASTRLQGMMQANVLIASAKERAGLERAMGATGLGGRFTGSVYDRFVALGGGQSALLAEVQGALGQSGWLDGLHNMPEYAAVQAARDRIHAGHQSGDFAGLTAPEWFATSTAWINLLRSHELEITQAVNTLSAELDAEAANNYNWTVGLTAVVGVLALVFTVGAFELLIRRITSLTAVVDGFTRGDFSIFVKGIDRKDELSLMARAIYRFKQDTLEMMRNAKKLEEEQLASKKAQDLVVDELRRGLADLSNGDLTVRFASEFPADYEDVRKDFNNTIAQLRDALGEVADASGSIDAGAVEINQASEDLSARTSSQAATLEQTAAALEQLTASVKSAADGARTVEHTTEDARREAASSGAVVQQAVAAMSEIEQSATQIAQITSVIDDIAFQTNLLALNAGVEAARAGEAGRGFAVVASEVRALAQRSSDAAMEIKTLIGNSAFHVEQGVELVNSAGEALESIVQRVTHISGLVSDIAEGAQEQSVGLAEINTGVVQLDGVTQKNVAMVENATAASQMLKSNAGQLSNTIGKFTLSGSATPMSFDQGTEFRQAG